MARRALFVSVVALLFVWPLQTIGDAQKEAPVVKIPDAGVPQVSTIEHVPAPAVLPAAPVRTAEPARAHVGPVQGRDAASPPAARGPPSLS